jgi:hypothetical protein
MLNCDFERDTMRYNKGKRQKTIDIAYIPQLQKNTHYLNDRF